MAFDREPKEHGYKTFGNNLKKDLLKDVILLCGKEEYLIEWAEESLVKKYTNEATIDMDYVTLDGLEAELSQLYQDCQTFPMLSDKKIIVVNNILGSRSKLYSEKELSEIIEGTDEGTLLVFKVAEELKSIKKDFFHKAILKKGEIYEFTQLNPPQLRSFIEKRIKESGKTISPKNLAKLIEESGYYTKENDYSLFNLEKDVAKLLAHSSNEIQIKDIEETVSDVLEHNTFALLDAISVNNKEEAFRLAKDLLLSGESPYKIIGSIANQVELLLLVKELRDEGQGLDQITKILKVHQFRVKKALSFSSKYSVETLRKILVNAYSCDEKIKAGTLSGDLAIELFIALI